VTSTFEVLLEILSLCVLKYVPASKPLAMLIAFVNPQGVLSQYDCAYQACLPLLIKLSCPCNESNKDTARELYETVGNKRFTLTFTKQLVALRIGFALDASMNDTEKATLFRCLLLLGNSAAPALSPLRRYRDSLDQKSVAWDRVDGMITTVEKQSFKH